MVRDALVVGVNRYQFLPSLNSPAHDAEAIAQVLQTYGDFRVSRLPEVVQSDPATNGQLKIGQKTPVTLRQLESALVRLFKPRGCQTPQSALFYFSGHGMQRDSGIQEGYLALSDSQPDVGFSGLSLFWLRRLLQESPVPQRIVILDCCHSGALMNFLEADPGARPGTDRLFMVATRDYDLAYESLTSSFSTFTQALLDGLDPRRQATGIVTNYGLTAWVSQALKAETQQPLFENSGSEIILTRCGAVQPPGEQPTGTVPSASEVCPYRGLACFEESHADFFFGREDLSDRLLETLQTNRFVAVVGASGIGKSSLVRAGLIARLRSGQAFAGSDRWRIRLITPTAHPLKSLASAFVDLGASNLERAEQLQRAETFLQDDADGLARLVQANLLVDTSSGLGDRPHFLLVIDQFEEVFTLSQGQAAARERERFFTALLGAVQSRQTAFSLVIVLRADFLGQCNHHPQLAQHMEHHQLLVPPLTYEQVKSTILHPAQKVGLHCDANLTYTLLLDIVGAPGELALLQDTLRELWQRRQYHPERQEACLTLDAYTELGGVRGVLQRRATETFLSLTAAEQQVAQRIFLSLTQLGEGTEDTRRRVFKAELLGLDPSHSLVEATLEKLIAARLVVSDRPPLSVPAPELVSDEHPSLLTASPVEVSPLDPIFSITDLGADGAGAIAPVEAPETVDVVHETLIRHWSLLRGWLAENRIRLRRQRGIEQAAQEWMRAGCPLMAGYLLRGSRLTDAEEFVATFPQELSPVARQFVAASQADSRRAKTEMRRLQIAIPTALVMALVVTFSQFHAAVRTQAEKDQQLQISQSREYAAIAQSILQEPGGNPMTALLISRLAAIQGHPTYEAQASVRAALQQARLQLDLAALSGPVTQIAVSPNQSHLAAVDRAGTIQIWRLASQTIYTTPSLPIQTLKMEPTVAQEMAPVAAPALPTANPEAPVEAAPPPAWKRLTFSPDGQFVAAIAPNNQQVKLWQVETGTLQHSITSERPIRHIQYSPTGQWLLIATDHSLILWNPAQAQVQAKIPHEGAIAVQFSPDEASLLWVGSDQVLRRWPLPPGASELERTPLTPAAPAGTAAASLDPTATWVASRDASGKVNLWHTQSGTLSRQLTLTTTASTPVPGSAVVEGSAWSLITRPLQGLRDATKPSPDAAILVTNPTGQWLVEADPRELRVWNTTTGALQMERQAAAGWAPETVPQWGAIALSPDGQTLATVIHLSNHPTHAQVLTLWHVPTGQETAVVPLDQAISTLQFTPDSTYLVTGSMSGAIQLWATDAGGELPTIASAEAPIGWARFLAPGSTTPESNTPENEGAIATLATITTQGTLHHWEVVSDLSAGGSILAQAPLPGQDHHHHRVGDQGTRSPYEGPQFLKADDVEAEGQFSHAAAWTAAGDQSPYRWVPVVQTEQPSPPASIPPPLPAPAEPDLPVDPVAAAVTPAGDWLAIATPSGQVLLSQTGQAKQARQAAQATPQPLSMSGSRAQPLGEQGSVLIYELAFSADGQRLLGVGDDFRIRLWDVPSGQLLQVLAGPHHKIDAAAFSPDGQMVATASADATVRLWEVATGQNVLTLPHLEAVLSLDFDPSGTLLAAGSLDGTTQIWHLPSGTTQTRLSGHQDAVLDVAFSPDGQWLTTASQDGTARLWEVATGTEQAHLRPLPPDDTLSPLVQAFFSPNGHYLATLTAAGQLYLWAATWESVLALARDRSLRDLTPDECLRYLRLSPVECPVSQTADAGG
ncbi:MAG: caspase family protein [Synechococcales bacterium]|nr:caspase family protein [Synechococcales bacterium]